MNKRTRKFQLNYYTRVLTVQKIFQEQHELGLSNEKIHEMHVYPRFFISRSTFYEYLTINAKAKLTELQNEGKSN